MNSWKSVLVLAALVPLSSACVMVGMPAGPGDELGQIPPRMTRGEDGKGLEWDSPAAFGPVPPTLQSTGNEVCQFHRFERATGYHPDARELDGSVIEGGGYFCVGSFQEPKPGDAPGQIPPRLEKTPEGVLTWDNPAAFGPVPPKLEAKGFRICRDAGYERATGYHPGARDLDGSSIKGGGFFCVGKAKRP